MSLKRFLLSTSAATVMLVGCETAAQAQIAVVDPSGLMEWARSIANQFTAYGVQLEQYGVAAKSYAVENLAWLQSVQAYALQSEQYASALQLAMNFIHDPSLGMAMGVLMGAGLGNSLPLQPYAMLGLVNGLENLGNGQAFGAIGGLLSNLTALSSQDWQANHIYSPTDGSWASAQMMGNANGIAGTQGMAQAAYGDFRTHEATLQPLRSNLLGAADTKSVLDASGAVQTEIAWNVNELGQTEAARAAAEAQQASIVQRDSECMSKNIEGFLSASPIQIGNRPANPGPCQMDIPAVGVAANSLNFGGASGGGAGGNTIGGDAGDTNIAALPAPPTPPATPVVAQ